MRKYIYMKEISVLLVFRIFLMLFLFKGIILMVKKICIRYIEM